METEANQASHVELCDRAANHYAMISSEQGSWNSLIPIAIAFYKAYGGTVGVELPHVSFSGHIMEARARMIQAVQTWHDEPCHENWQSCIEGMDLIGEVASARWRQKYEEGKVFTDEYCEVADDEYCEVADAAKGKILEYERQIEKYEESASDLMAEIVSLKDVQWTDDQIHLMVVQVEAMINAVRECDQILNPGYREHAYHAITRAFVLYVQDMLRKWGRCNSSLGGGVMDFK